MESYEVSEWWKFMDGSLRDLMKQSMDLLTHETGRAAQGFEYSDYSFVVFPAGKAYEGFLKKVLLELKLISSQQYYSDHFRIGRALSPTLPKSYRVGWVYGKLVSTCGGEMLPLEMWEVWKKARNRTFHFFPQHTEHITLEQAKGLLSEITVIMERTLTGCRLVDNHG